MNIASKGKRAGQKSEKRPKVLKRRPGIGYLEKVLEKCSLAVPSSLPIFKSCNEISEAISKNQVVIIVGETGSGKTTQIPKICLAAGCGRSGRIAVTQPRRIAAVSMARRLAEELGPAGREAVGYKIRFRDRCPPLSRVWFVTDGLLLAQLPKDPKLRSYDTIIVDEAHERSLNIDFLLGVLRRLLDERQDLKVIITSATLDVSKFARAFKDPPVIEVEGRGHPVEVIHLDPERVEMAECGPADLAVEAIKMIRQRDLRGHILAFLPTEQSIMEGMKVLQGELGEEAEVMPMFGRLSGSDQARIFEPSARQKIVLSTNVAETSVTVPGIKYVVDTGLARISHYNPRTRTKALPVTRISRSSADQRAGRAGRTGPGVCIRLYSEEDYLSRPRFTPPEILRSNLAEAVLRLKYLRLGNVLDFPFVDPPSPQAVKEAETSLKLLGALKEDGNLTGTGRLMARLPLDPRISKMILEARRWNCVKEVVIIAAALSIQDPRERPSEKQSQADQAHSRFRDKYSDFVTFLNIWNGYQALFRQKKSRRERMAFCRENYLSFRRMEEWIDAFSQIKNILDENGSFPMNQQPASYEQIHRAVLPGLLDQIACRKKGSLYSGARGRELHLFPGSSIYKTRPDWIVAAEITRTSQLFARIAAMIEPKWLEQAGSRFLKHSYSNPAWDRMRGEVTADEKVTLFGLTIVESRKVSFDRIEPEMSHEIFLRQALLPGELRRPYGFMKHNMSLLKELEDLQNRLRKRDLMVDEEALVSFYKRGLHKLIEIAEKRKDKSGKPLISRQQLSSLALLSRERDLSYLLKLADDDAPLRFTKDFLTNRMIAPVDALFPGHIAANGHELPLRYRFETGNERDGISVQIPVELIHELSPEPFEWLVPGLLEEKVSCLLKGLPKRLRKGLIPISDTVQKALSFLDPGKGSLYGQLQLFLKKEYGLNITSESWPSNQQLPLHLFMRFEIVGRGGKIIAHGRNFAQLRDRFSRFEKRKFTEGKAWRSLEKEWQHERIDIDFLDKLPERLEFKVDESGRYVNAWVGLVAAPSGKGAGSALFLNENKAMAETRKALTALLAHHLTRELRQIAFNAIPGKEPFKLMPLFPDQKLLVQNIITFLLGELSTKWNEIPGKEEFLAEVKRLKACCFKDSRTFTKQIHSAISRAVEVRALINNLFGSKTSGLCDTRRSLDAELRRLMPEDFPKNVGRKRLENLGRYLKALEIRTNRAYSDPAKDARKDRKLRLFLDKVNTELTNLHLDRQETTEQLTLALEEYRISIFAPELGTLFPVSEKRILKTLHKNPG